MCRAGWSHFLEEQCYLLEEMQDLLEGMGDLLEERGNFLKGWRIQRGLCFYV